jgi:hypothetical protein
MDIDEWWSETRRLMATEGIDLGDMGRHRDELAAARSSC